MPDLIDLIDLDEPAALDPRLVGVKAARLAAARLACLPVLDGIVIASSAAASAMAAGQAAVDAGRMPAARAAAGAARPTGNFGVIERAVGRLGPELVVRSSSLFDDDGRWAGAFATYGEVAPSEVVVAIRGCWASAFAPAALARFDRAGGRPADAGLAVLVQPQVRPEAGGWAVRLGTAIEIAAVRGSPSPLLAGEVSGERIRLAGGAVVGGPPKTIAVATAELVATLVERAFEALGTDRVEWAVVDGRPVLFQLALGPGGAQEAGPDPRPSHATAVHPAYRALAGWLLDRRGPLFDALVAPWILGVQRLGLPSRRVAPRARAAADPRDLWREVTASAAVLQAAAEAATGLGQAALLDRLAHADGEIADALDPGRAAGAAPPIYSRRASQVLDGLDLLIAALVERRVLPHPSAAWWQADDWIDRALAGRAAPAAPRRAVNRFDGLVTAIVAEDARALSGIGASPGRAVGRTRPMGAPAADAGMGGRILVVDAPLPGYGPLLWTAAGLVALTGSPGAHLCEIARSLRVPAVVGVGDLEFCALDGRFAIAIDGWTGEVLVADAGSEETEA